MIKKEIDNGIRSDRIVVGGFSQGSVISLLTGLRSEHTLAGTVIYSGFLPMANTTKKVTNSNSKNDLSSFFTYLKLDGIQSQ